MDRRLCANADKINVQPIPNSTAVGDRKFYIAFLTDQRWISVSMSGFQLKCWFCFRFLFWPWTVGTRFPPCLLSKRVNCFILKKTGSTFLTDNRFTVFQSFENLFLLTVNGENSTLPLYQGFEDYLRPIVNGENSSLTVQMTYKTKGQVGSKTFS